MSVTKETVEDKIEQIKAATADLPAVVTPTAHFLVDGMYVRQILIPAGTAFVGRKHLKQHYFMCLKGGAMVTADDGSINNLRAGMILICAPGAQRIGVTYEDTVFATVHRTEETMLENIELDCVEFDPTIRHGVGNVILQKLPEKPS